MDLALELIWRLRHEPMSMFRAEQAGTEDIIGWSPTVAALAAVYDAIATQAKGKKLKDSERYPRPKVKQKQELPRPNSVAELDWGAALGG